MKERVEKLFKLLDAHGLQQNKLAERTGITVSMISRYRNGKALPRRLNMALLEETAAEMAREVGK